MSDPSEPMHWTRRLGMHGVPPLVYSMMERRLDGRPEFDELRRIANTEEKPSTITIYGPNGNGKTHMGTLLFAFIFWRMLMTAKEQKKELNGYTPDALWTSANKMSLRMKNFGRDHFNLEDEMKQFVWPSILMIDDLYAEGASEYDNRILVDMMEQRINEFRTTIITTNMTIQDIEQKFSPRLADRLRGGEVVRFTGTSHRGLK